MDDYTDLLLEFNVDRNRRGVRLRVFANEEEMYSAANRRQSVEEHTVSLPPDVFDPGTQSTFTPGETRKDKQRQSFIESGFARYVGQGLFDALPNHVRASITAPKDRTLRLKISSDSRSLMSVPWEWMMAGDQPLALRDDVRIIRSVPVRFASPRVKTTLPLRVLLVVSNPKDERLFNPQLEIDSVAQPLHRPEFQWTVLEEPTLPSLRDTLESLQPHIVHYIGHGGVSSGDGNIILHENDVSHWVDSTVVSRFLPSCVRLLCLSTCFTNRNYQIAGLERLAQAPASTTLPSAVVNRFPVREPAVRTFWSAFYAELINSCGNLIEAVHRGWRDAYAETPNAYDWSSFALVVRDNVGWPSLIGESTAESTDVSAAQDIRAQFKADVLNEFAEQIKVLGGDASDELLQRMQSTMNVVEMSTSRQKE